MRLLIIVALSVGSLLAELPHPRLLFPSSMETEVETRIQSDPLAKQVHELVVGRAEQILNERTCEYLIPDGKRLLAESRRAMANVLYCGLAWRTTDDLRFRDRVILELDAAVALKDWNPSHFLDTAEMATAVAIGYDWLYDSLTAEQRTRYEDALITKGLQAVKLEYGKNPWWFKGPKNNWSQVCGTGMALAAEVVQEREPELSARVLADAKKLLESCKSFYLPEGAYPEGPGYWHYGTNYHVMGLAAYGTFGKTIEVPAILERSGDFMMQIVGPTGVDFNFADGNARERVPTPAQSWIASHFNNPAQSHSVRSQLEAGIAKGLVSSKKTPGQYFPLHLLWLPAETDKGAPVSLAASFAGEQALAFARTGWDREAAWLAIKGGTGAASHGHLDAGSFVYEAGDVRWFNDLGSDDYNMPGYFSSKRWNYLRLTNRAHNTLVIDGLLQADPATGCPVSQWKENGADRAVTIDLTSAYANQATAVTRRATFGTKDGYVLMEDHLKEPTGDIRWAFVTLAKVDIDGETVTLSRGGKRLVMTRLDTAGGEWEEYSLKPKTERENQNKAFRLIGFTAKPKAELTLQVAWKLE